MSEPPTILEPVRQVFENPILLKKIASCLDHGNSRDLVTALSVSRAFFDASASVLCRRVEVPVYEFSTRKKREIHTVDMACSSPNQDQPETFALPNYVLRQLTVIVKGNHRNVCRSPGHTLTCGFLPRHPFRLVFDSICDGMVCGSCTSPYLLSKHVETLVIRLSYDSPRFHCATRKFPDHFNPSRLILLFPQEPSQEERRRRAGYPNNGHIFAHGPGEGGDSSSNELARLANTFYRLAAMALAVNNDCQIYIVAADNAALHVGGLERHDSTLPEMDPLYPDPQKGEICRDK